MKKRLGIAAAGAALILGGGMAYAAGSSSTATCAVTDPSPVVTVTNGVATYSSGVTCTATLPVVTVTVPATPSPTTTTVAPPPTTTTPPPPPSTTTPPPPPAPGAAWVRPTAATTGYSGTLTPWTGSLSPTLNNQTLTNVDFAGYLKLAGANIVLDNCHLNGLAFYGPGPLTVKNCTIDGGTNSDSWYRAISGVTFDHDHFIPGNHDGVDVFGSNGHVESNITLVDSLIDGMSFPAGSTAHGDGLQVRGVNGLTVQRVVINDGPYQPQDNSAIYFENVNGGDSNMHLADMDLYGGGYTFYTNGVSASSATNVAILQPGHWGSYHANVQPSGWSFTNVTGPSGSQINP